MRTIKITIPLEKGYSEVETKKYDYKKECQDIRKHTIKQGKYKNKTLLEVYNIDPEYVNYVANKLDNKTFKSFLWIIKNSPFK